MHYFAVLGNKKLSLPSLLAMAYRQICKLKAYFVIDTDAFSQTVIQSTYEKDHFCRDLQWLGS